MRYARIFLVGFVVLAIAVASGCAKRQLTRSETDRLDAIAAKIAEAERLGAAECAPKELAKARADLENARRKMAENPGKAEADVKAAEASADELLAKTKACVEAKKAAAAPAPAPASTPPAPAPAPAPASPPETEESMFDSIHFDFDKFAIREDARPTLLAVAEYLKGNKAAKIRIEGHCDDRGTSEYNMALGDRRANAAKKYLVGLGIDAMRLSTVSFGKEKPLDPAQTEEAWAKNRRDTFLLVK